MSVIRWIVACSLAGIGTAVSPALSSAHDVGTPPRLGLASGQAGGRAVVQGDPYYYFVRARHLESEGDIDGALKALQQAAALDPRSAEIRAELAGLYARQNRAREAIEWAQAAIKLDEGNAEANRVLGIVYSSLARADDDAKEPGPDAADYSRKAIRHLEAARKRAGGLDASLDLMLGRLYMRTGDTDKGIATLRRLAEEEPDRDEPIAILAQAYRDAGRTDEAVRLLQQSAATHPEFYGTLGELYERQQDWAAAEESYSKALERNPQSIELKTRLAVTLLSQGGAAGAGRAAAALADVRRQTPTDTHVLYLLAQAQRLAGQLDDAETTAKQLAALSPSSLTGPYALAQVYDQKQQYRRIVETLQPVVDRSRPAAGKAVELVPLVLMLASAYEELGDFDQALSTFESVRKIAPENGNVDLYELGTLVSARRFTAALDRSKALLAAHPGDPRVVRLRAEALRGAGRPEEAVALLRQALQDHPQDVSAYLSLSEMYAATKQYPAAVSVLREAEKAFPEDLTVQFQLGSVLDREGRTADAERAFRGVLAKDPLHAGALNYLGYMMADRGERLDEAIGFIRRALQVEPYNGAYLDSLGWAYLKANRLDLAEENLRKAAEQRLRDSAVQDHFGDLLFRLGRYREAVGAWRRALDGDGEQIDRAAIDRKIRSAADKASKR